MQKSLTLIEQFINGDRRAFAELYLIHADSLYGFVLKLTKSPNDAEDIVQDVFLRLWDNRSKIDISKSIKSYIFQIAYNLFVDQFRKRINSIDFEDFLLTSEAKVLDDNNVEQMLTYDDYCLLINKSLNKLTDKQRCIYRMSRDEGFSTSEIGMKLGLSDKTIKNQLSIILRLLRTELLVLLISFLYFTSCYKFM